MAQVLKESSRKKILEAAKKELLEKGYRDASMRSIAFHSGMTAGNLYRYYKSKDELIQVIVTPALMELNTVIQEKTKDRLSLFQKTSSLDFSQEEILHILDSLADDLVFLFQKHHDEILILFLDSEVQMQIRNWFAQLIQTLILERYEQSRAMISEMKLLAQMLASSIFSGIQECFRQTESLDRSSQNLRGMIRLYFRLYLSMLNFDVKSLGVEA